MPKLCANLIDLGEYSAFVKDFFILITQNPSRTIIWLFTICYRIALKILM